MKRLLYVTVNSKPESLSASKTVGRALVNSLKDAVDHLKIEELDLYDGHIPRLKYEYFCSRNCIVDEACKAKLSKEEQKEVNHIIALCDQFIAADYVVFAVPMWSLSFPAPLKEYLDCIIQVDKTITFEDKMPHGLLGDKPRTVFYVQSSGASINLMSSLMLNKGLHYVKEMTQFMGIKTFKELLVDNTGTTEGEKQRAIEAAIEKIPHLVKPYHKEEK